MAEHECERKRVHVMWVVCACASSCVHYASYDVRTSVVRTYVSGRARVLCASPGEPARACGAGLRATGGWSGWMPVGGWVGWLGGWVVEWFGAWVVG